MREAGFDRLVCVSNILNIIRFLNEMGKETDGLGMVFEMCRGAFSDIAWFRQVTTLVSDPEHRARFIDVSANWWYLDDLAAEYLAREGRTGLLKVDEGRRILAPNPEGDGKDILDWLRTQEKKGPCPRG